MSICYIFRQVLGLRRITILGIIATGVLLLGVPPAQAARACKALYGFKEKHQSEKKSEIEKSPWFQKFETDPTGRYVLTTPEGKALLAATKSRSTAEFVAYLQSSNGEMLSGQLKERFEILDQFLGQIRTGRAKNGDKVVAGRLSAEEKILIDFFASRRLSLVSRQFTGSEVFATREPPRPETVATTVEENLSSQDRRRFVELSEKKKKSLKEWLEEMRICRRGAPVKQERQNLVRSIGVQIGTSAAFTSYGHYSTYGWSQMQLKDIATDMLPNVLLSPFKTMFLNDRNAGFLMRWIASSLMNGVRVEVDAVTYFFQPFKKQAPNAPPLGDEDHYQSTVNRTVFNTLYNLAREPINIGVYFLLQGLRCLADSGKLGIPKGAIDGAQVLDSLVFTRLYYYGREYFVDENHIAPVVGAVVPDALK